MIINETAYKIALALKAKGDIWGYNYWMKEATGVPQVRVFGGRK